MRGREKRLTRLLERFYGARGVQFELSVIVGADIVIPDVLVLANEHPAMRRDILNEPPLLCVEALSPSQLPSEVTEIFSGPCQARLLDVFAD